MTAPQLLFHGPTTSFGSVHKRSLLVVAFLFLFAISSVSTQTLCDSDEFCQEVLQQENAKCLPSGRCSNPFHQGCLNVLGKNKENETKRTCNSDDNGDVDKENCVGSDFDYPEIRIHNANWEESIFQAWLHQIFLMEFVGVPATVGLSNEDTKMASFYSIENTMEFSSTSYPYDALAMANEVEECYLTNETCVNVLPEVWGGQMKDVDVFVKNGTFETPFANGVIGQAGFYIPAFTAKEFPFLSIYFGLQGEENRQFLAETFKRPMTWLAYCQEISSSGCAIPDETALEPPGDLDEEGRYFQEGLYRGYFQATEKNNCGSQNNSTNTSATNNCTGHVVIGGCTSSSNALGQLYWNDIVGLEADGPLLNGGYNLTVRQEVWKAANATKSHVMMVWNQPSYFLEEFFGSEFEFKPILLPTPTQICEENRPSVEERCSEDIETRRGDPLGACDSSAEALQKVMASSLEERTMASEPVDRSPAFFVLRSLKISELEMRAIFQSWIAKGATGDRAREALCEWVSEHQEELTRFIPPGYPRFVIPSEYTFDIGFIYAAMAVGIFAVLTSLTFFFLCWKFRTTKVMIFAQPVFMMVILTGFFFVSLAGVMETLPPSRQSCISRGWFRYLGYSIELVPLLIKTSAINKLIRSSKKNQKVNISRNRLLKQVALALTIVCTFLICWTILDPPVPVTSRVIFALDPNLVFENVLCGSEKDWWGLLALLWQILLLLMVMLLAYQSRNALQQFNESQSLVFLGYSHFLFMVINLIVSMLYIAENILPYSVISAMFSFTFSLDAWFGMMIYVSPKVYRAWKTPETGHRGTLTARTTTISPEDDEIKVLLCSGNLGNAEPTTESIEAWIPPDGICELVSSLDGGSLNPGYFGLIVIGMQESTWKEPKKDTESIKKVFEDKNEDLDADDVLNAFEQHHTATLREMIQDVLGEEYSAVAEDQRGQMRLYIYALNSVFEDIEDLCITGCNTGIGNVLANKGGIVITLNYRKTRMTFVTAHLAAHEGESYYKARCDNVRTILREAKTSALSNKLDVSLSSHHIFVMGDLNFRTKFETEGSSHEENVKRASDMIEAKDFEGLYSFDELHKGVEKGDLLFDFKTLPCHFPPTFKVLRESGFQYKNQRCPSYTDRILFKSTPGLESKLKPLAYEPCVNFITSDHKPIRGAFSISPNEISEPFMKMGTVRFVFRDMKGFALPAADKTGKSDPYLMFLWECVELDAERKPLYDKFKTLIKGRSWPKTSYISQNLNPDWGGETLSLIARDPVICTDAMLYIVAMDYDTVALYDNYLGALALNVNDIMIRIARSGTKEIAIDSPLQRDGRQAGRISFRLEVQMEGSAARRPVVHYLNPRDMDDMEFSSADRFDSSS